MFRDPSAGGGPAVGHRPAAAGSAATRRRVLVSLPTPPADGSAWAGFLSALQSRFDVTVRFDPAGPRSAAPAPLQVLTTDTDAALVAVPENGAAADGPVAFTAAFLAGRLGAANTCLVTHHPEPTLARTLGLKQFTLPDDIDGDEVDALARDVSAYLGAAPGGEPPARSAAGALGFDATLRDGQRALRTMAADLRRALENPAYRLLEPLRFDSAGMCVSTYVEALNLVRHRFWTTTFLSSGFWTHRLAPVIDANTRMMARLRHRGETRRLFLLDQPPDTVAQSYREQLSLLDRLGKEEELERVTAEFRQLRLNVEALQADGCVVRVAHDRDGAFAALPAEMCWEPDDSELAIYDDFRADVFDGGRSGQIRGVRSFTAATHGFGRYMEAAEAFFLGLWRSGEEIGGFLDRLEKEIGASRSRIHYRANWLALYEFALDEDDAELKRGEGAYLEALLRRRHRWGAIERYLDIGTCTGRYPLLLRPAVRDGGLIVGLDDDPECLHFTRGNIRRTCPDDPRLAVVGGDFLSAGLRLPASAYQLITCMMSTLSHFGRHRNERLDDAMQRALRRAAGLLDAGGLLVFSVWSEHALHTGHFLSIYEERDRERLMAWTPERDELERRVRAAGLTVLEVGRPDARLDVWVCRRDTGAS